MVNRTFSSILLSPLFFWAGGLTAQVLTVDFRNRAAGLYHWSDWREDWTVEQAPDWQTPTQASIDYVEIVGEGDMLLRIKTEQGMPSGGFGPVYCVVNGALSRPRERALPRANRGGMTSASTDNI